MERIEEIKNKSKKKCYPQRYLQNQKGSGLNFPEKIAGKNSRKKIILQLNNTLEFETW